MSVRDSVGLPWGLALLGACGSKAATVSVDAQRAELVVTSSLDRGSTDISPSYSATTLGGQTTILAILAILDDRLLSYQPTHPTIQLAPSEHLVAAAGGARIALDEQIVRVRGHDYFHTEYTATLPTNDPGTFAIELDRADGSILTSTLNVFAPFHSPRHPLTRPPRVMSSRSR